MYGGNSSLHIESIPMEKTTISFMVPFNFLKIQLCMRKHTKKFHLLIVDDEVVIRKAFIWIILIGMLMIVRLLPLPVTAKRQSKL